MKHLNLTLLLTFCVITTLIYSVNYFFTSAIPLNGYDPSAYADWEANKFDINCNFSKDFSFLESIGRRSEWLNLLETATINGYTNVVKALIEAEADIVSNYTVAFRYYYNLVEGSTVKTTQELAKNKVEEYWAEQREKSIVEKKDIQGRTLLHLAAESGNTETAKFLLDQKMDVDAKDNKGHTPLFFAAAGGHRNMVEFLKQNGANIIKAIQQTQAIGFACTGGIAAIIGIPVAIKLPLTAPITAGVITLTTMLALWGL